MMARDARILFVDEPTAALSETEAHSVLQVLRRLAESGCAVVLVTHRLDEIKDFADRVTVIRDGIHHGPLEMAGCTTWMASSPSCWATGWRPCFPPVPEVTASASRWNSTR